MKSYEKAMRNIRNECFQILAENLYPIFLARHPRAGKWTAQMNEVWDDFFADMPWDTMDEKEAFLRPLFDAMGRLEMAEQKRAFRRGLQLAFTGRRAKKNNARCSPQHRQLEKVLRMYQAMLSPAQAERLNQYQELNQTLLRAG